MRMFVLASFVLAIVVGVSLLVGRGRGPVPNPGCVVTSPVPEHTHGIAYPGPVRCTSGQPLTVDRSWRPVGGDLCVPW